MTRLAPLTLPIASDVAERLCAAHRADMLREYPSASAWARSRIEISGTAWAFFVAASPMFAGGVVSRGAIGEVWFAGCEGWTRYVKHAIRVWRSIRSSGAYKRYVCEVDQADPVALRFAERMGFRVVGSRDGFVVYGVTP